MCAFRQILAVLLLAFATVVPSDAQDPARLMRQITDLTKAGKLDEAVQLGGNLVASVEKAAGRDHPATASALFVLGQLHTVQGKLDDAESTLKRALTIREKALGRDHAEVAATLDRLGGIAIARGNYADAEHTLQRALGIYERTLGSDHHDTAAARVSLARIRHAEARYGEAEALFAKALAALRKSTLPEHRLLAVMVISNLAVVAQDQGNLALAETRLREALSIQEKSHGPESLNVGNTLNNLAEVYVRQGRYAEAEGLMQRALQIAEKTLGPEHGDVASRLGNLATLLTYRGRANEAEGLHRRALAIAERALGSRHPDVASILNNLAHALDEQGRAQEAETLYRRSLALREAVLGRDHASVASSLANVASLLFSQRRLEEAVPLSRRALAIRQKVLGDGHPQVGASLNDLAVLLDGLKRHDEARPLLRQALVIREAALGNAHPDIAVTLSNLGQHHLNLQEWPAAYTNFRRSYAIWVGRRNAQSGAPEEGRRNEIRNAIIDPHMGLAIAAYHMADGAPADTALALRAEAFEAAQWAGGASAGGAIERMGARVAAGGALAELVRERQDLAEQAPAVDRALIAAISQPKRTSAAQDALRQRADGIARRLKEIDAALAARFPQYAALIGAGPVSIGDAAHLLRPDEALLLFAPTNHATYLWAVTRDASRWVRIPLGREKLGEHVAALRCGLDAAGAWSGAGAPRCRELLKLAGPPPGNAGLAPFDLARAHALYRALFGQVEDLIEGKHLLIVPAGPLASFPFHVLVAEAPGGVAPTGSGPSPQEAADRGLARVEGSAPVSWSTEHYAQTSWLARRHAISHLPSVASLRALRRLAQQSQANAPFIGFGNPLLTGSSGTDRSAWERQSCRPSATRVTSAGRGAPAPALLRGGLAQVEALRRQAPLPETADELCTVARLLGAPEASVHLGAGATERRIKELSVGGALRSARFVHFATHGLLATEARQVSQGLAEPALLLTPPTQATEEDDGLLTASEVAQLKLNADWVILSACNTAAGDNFEAEALSGLARAFFYAGSRALLASHWYVDSEAAVALVTAAFAEMNGRPGVGRAEALRRAMLALLGRGGRSAHPATWAPFVVVGEGAG